MLVGRMDGCWVSAGLCGDTSLGTKEGRQTWVGEGVDGWPGKGVVGVQCSSYPFGMMQIWPTQLLFILT